MVLRKTIRKIAALGTGAVMVGSSILGASAADLSQYPSQYIKDGKFTGVMVVGDKAAAEDVIGVSDIAVSLQASAVKPAGSGSSSVSVENGWQVETSTDQFELSENPEALNQESIADIVGSTYIEASELPELLASGEVSNSKGVAQYDQHLYFEDTTTGYVQYIESEQSDETADFLVFENGKQLARYELEFSSALESDIDTDTTPDNLEDLEDIEIEMLGVTYTIVTATVATNDVILTLMGGATRDTLLEGDTKTYTIDGNDYEVTLDFTDATSAKFTVNGESTNQLEDGETDKLADGTTIGVSEILYQDYAGGVHSATFFLGAQKVELRDTDVEVGTSSHELEVDDETIDGVDVIIEATVDGTSDIQIDSITINMTAQDTYYVPAGGKLSENPDLDEADLLFTRNWDISYGGLSQEDTTEIKVSAAGDDDYNLEFVDASGNVVDVPLAHTPSGTTVQLGDNDDNLHVSENSSIDTDDYFVLTDYSDDDGERQSYVLQYQSSDALTDDSPKIRFKNMGSGETVERTLSAASNNLASTFINSAGTNGTFTEVAQIKLGGGTFRVYNQSSTAADDFVIYVDMDGQDDETGGETVDGIPNIVALNNKDGARISIVPISGTQINFNVSTPNADDRDDLTATPLGFSITAASAELSLTASGSIDFLEPEDDEDNSYVYTSYGAFAQLSSPTNSPEELTIEYPENQRTAQVFITGSGATFTEVAASEGDAVTIQKIDVGATKLASEVADIEAVNSILVGGPCANAAAAAVMGNPADCTAGFEPGVGKIQMWDVGTGNVAMLVAGYSALDTRNAAQVVANARNYANLKGDSVEVRRVNNQLTVAAPTPAAMEEEEEEEVMEETEETTEEDNSTEDSE